MPASLYEASPRYERGMALIARLAVAVEYQGQGYGRDLLIDIDVKGVELRVHPARHSCSARHQVLGPGVGADAHGDAFADGPILLDILFIHVGRQAAVHLLCNLA